MIAAHQEPTPPTQTAPELRAKGRSYWAFLNICAFNNPLLFLDLMNWIAFVALKATNLPLEVEESKTLKPDSEEKSSLSSCAKGRYSQLFSSH